MSTRVTLTATEGPFEGREFEFAGRTLCTIGRSHDCNLCLTTDGADLTISRRHCLLEVEPPAVRLHDLGSRNGTFVNGEPLGRRRPGTRPGEPPPVETSPRTLHDGDTVRLGGSVFLVGIEDEPEDGHPEEYGEGTSESYSGESRVVCC
jgi:pSer/pThr/pTyr-binding forkhead associated (FHA) protein